MTRHTQPVPICLLSTIFFGSFLYYTHVFHTNKTAYIESMVINHTTVTGYNKTNAIASDCQEHIYSFGTKLSTITIFNDTELWTKCGINSSTLTEEAPLFDHPRIRTKCSNSEGKLVSHKRQARKDEKGFLVPNIVHYIIFGKGPFTFLNYISIRSADKFIKPQFIFIHGDGQMQGEWWNKTIEDVPNIFFIYRPQIEFIQDQKPGSLAHQADVIRLQILQDNGGIYLDTDVIVLKSFDPLRRNYSLTMGRPSTISVANGIIVAAPRQPFMCVWYQGYKDYDPERRGAWGYYSVITAHKLAQLFPHHIHIEERSLLHPSWTNGELPLLFDEIYDWSNNYAIHVWKSLRPKQVPKGPDDIENLNTTLGQIMRHVYL